ncbi:MAG TPA: hypothetical protein VER79_01785, partial [Candidatus Limnocylindrales bacterium]|nr:hypothetical protein [Candidatus Limnocylindrales bacterium]
MHAVLFIDHGDDRWRQTNQTYHNVGAQRAAPTDAFLPVRAQHAAPLQYDDRPRVVPQSLGAIVRGYKSAVTKRVNDLRGTPAAPVWQRNDYDHIFRDESDLNAIRAYIETNPARWGEDREDSLNRPVWNRLP